MLNFEQKRAVLSQLPDFMLLSGVEDEASNDCGAVEAQNAAQVTVAFDHGRNRKQIFYVDPAREGLESVLDKCRIVVSSMEALKMVNAVSESCGVVTMVGLTLRSEGFSDSTGKGISTEALRDMVYEIKQLKNVSVCGCIVLGDAQGLSGKELGKLIRSSYQTAKAMTYILPCSMPYIVVANSLEAIVQNQREHPENFEDFLTAANIVGMQNATAFYANYYLQ